jgi:endonuclease YncB( thermonuclease family)
MTDTPSAAAGWYPDARGETRYWDGHQWTDLTATNYPYAQAKQEPRYSASTVPVVAGVTKRPWVRRWQFWLVVAVVTFFGIGAIGNATTPDSTGDASNKPAANEDPVRASDDPTPTTKPTRTTKPPIVLLFVIDQKDGDSWVASDGKEYRLGLINTPERNERCGPEATAFTRKFLDNGFVVDAYETDSYGRSVAEVRDKTGKSLNVALAKSGLGDDRYLEQFRHENPDLGRRLDNALASAATPAC